MPSMLTCEGGKVFWNISLNKYWQEVFFEKKKKKVKKPKKNKKIFLKNFTKN